MTRKNLIKIVLLCASMAIAAACLNNAAKTPPLLTGASTPDPVPQRASSKTFEKFSHDIAEHKQFQCASCHQRESGEKDLEYAGHDSCVGCHMSQFTQSNTETAPPMCFVCHDKVTNPPTMKGFPHTFLEGFNMKFNHKAHESGAGKPANGCAFCHSPSGAGQTIQIGIETHNNCYTCHKPETKIGSCVTCHELAPYKRITQANYANFKAIFSHKDHTAAQKVSCEECHSVQAGTTPGKQVASIAILEHRTSPGFNCLKCHDGSRAFTGNNPANPNCTRCHVGMTAPLPKGTYGVPDTAAAAPLP